MVIQRVPRFCICPYTQILRPISLLTNWWPPFVFVPILRSCVIFHSFPIRFHHSFFVQTCSADRGVVLRLPTFRRPRDGYALRTSFAHTKTATLDLLSTCSSTPTQTIYALPPYKSRIVPGRIANLTTVVTLTYHRCTIDTVSIGTAGMFCGCAEVYKW